MTYIVVLPSVKLQKDWQTGDVSIYGATGLQMAKRKSAIKNHRALLGVSTTEHKTMPTDLTKYVTSKQAAEMLGIDYSNIRHLLLDGRLKGIKMGHYWLVFIPSIQTYQKTKSPKGRPSSGIPKLHEVK